MTAPLRRSLLCAAALLCAATFASAEPADELFAAIKENDLDAVKKLIQQDKSLLKAIDESNSWQQPTVLMASMPDKKQAIFDYLLQAGADPNQKNGRGETLVHFLKHADTDRVDQVLAAGGDLNVRDAHGMTLLHYTVADNRMHKIARHAVAKGADVNARSNYGMTPLHFGVARGAQSFLLPAGADVNAQDWRGRTPAFYAKHVETLRELGPFDAADVHGWTILHEAAWDGNAKMVEMLLAEGVTITADDQGATPLHAAARMNEPAIAGMLLKAGVDPSWQDVNGRTARDIAVARGYGDVVTLLESAPAAQSPRTDMRATLPASAADKLILGDLVLERPTLICLGFRWYIDGDANRNATCDVAYRKKGESAWQSYYPAIRVGGEVSGQENVAEPRLAGSIMNLASGVTYEVKLTAVDPDGVTGRAEQIVTMTTRAEPQAFVGGRTLHVYAESHAGAKQSPHFADIQAAYDDAQAGDVVLVHEGTHHRDLVMNKQATVEKPIVIRGDTSGGRDARIQGQGNNIINVDGSAHHIFEDLTLHDADAAFLARGETHALTVRRCKIYDVGRCVFAISNRNKDFLILDNDMRGPVKDWHPRESRKSQGVWIAGQGHVAAHNRIKGYWDGLSIVGRHDVPRDLQNCAIDFYNNDLREFYDDAIEMDYGVANIRVMRNVIRNTFMGISTQPVEGGPGYIYRNTVYASSRSPLKLNMSPSGLLIFHNTFIADGTAALFSGGNQNILIYNNLFIGKGKGDLINGGTVTASTDLDYNAYRNHITDDHKGPWVIRWNRFHPGYTPSGGGLNDTVVSRSFDEFARATYNRYEQHGGWWVDYDDFVTARAPDVDADQHDERPLDLRLRDDSAAIDKGKTLIGFNDDHTGAAPDLGAMEHGQAPPHYGPRK